MVAKGTIPSIKLGDRRLVRREALRELLDQLAAAWTRAGQAEAPKPTTFAIRGEELLKEGFNSGYSTLLYILMRGRNAVDWLNPDIRVGDELGDNGKDA